MQKVKWGILGIVAFLIISTTANISFVSAQKWIIDDVLIEGEYGLLGRILLIIATCIIGISASFVIQPVIQAKLSAKLTIIFTNKMIRSIQTMPVVKFRSQRSGKYINHFNEDIKGYVNLIVNDLPTGFQLLLNTFLLLGIILYSNPIILGVVLLFAVFYSYLSKKIGNRLRCISTEIQEHKSSLVVHIEEAVSGTRDIVAFNRQSWMENNYINIFNKLISKIEDEVRITKKKVFYSDPFKWSVNVAILGYGGWLVIQDTITLGLFVVIYQLSSQLLDSLQKLFDFSIELNSKFLYVDRINKFLNLIDDESKRQPFKGDNDKLTPHHINIENVSFQYDADERVIIDHIDMTFTRGQKVAIVGKSGSGKTTIADLLIKYLEPAKGDILVNNSINLKDIDSRDWLGKVAIVFQDPYILADTIRTNLLLGRSYINEQDMEEACKKAQLHDFIITLPNRYDTFVGERGITLSGGQKQRLALARIILADPEVMILDEPTSGLDVVTEENVMAEIDKMAKDKIIVIITHRLSTIKNADMVYVMDNGKIVSRGKFNEIESRLLCQVQEV